MSGASSHSLKSMRIVILPVLDFLAPRTEAIKTLVEENGAQVFVRYASDTRSKIKTFVQLPILCYKVIGFCRSNGINVVHATHITQLILGPFLKLFGIHFVYDAMERYAIDFSELYVKQKYKKKARSAIERIENFFVRNYVDGVLCVSSKEEVLLSRYLKNCNNSQCIFNVPSLDLLRNVRLNSKFSEKKFKIAFVAIIANQEVLDRVVSLSLSILKHNPRIEIHLIGPFEEKLPKDQSNLFKEFVEKNPGVYGHGRLQYKEMLSLLRHCHVGLNLYSLASRLKFVGPGSSRKNFVYMASGMVVISTDIGDIASPIKSLNAGFAILDPSNLENITSIVTHLNKNRVEALKMARNGVLGIKEQYNWENEKYKVLDTYVKVKKATKRNRPKKI